MLCKISMFHNQNLRPIAYGMLASVILLVVYFGFVSLVSGWGFAKNQFFSFWYFIMSLAIGFGIQVGLFTYLKKLVRGGHGSGKVLGVTGTTSAMAMVSCCAHYLANLLPILGVTGVLTFVTQYQIQFFWVGLLFNIGGIFYVTWRIIKFKRT